MQAAVPESQYLKLATFQGNNNQTNNENKSPSLQEQPGEEHHLSIEVHTPLVEMDEQEGSAISIDRSKDQLLLDIASDPISRNKSELLMSLSG